LRVDHMISVIHSHSSSSKDKAADLAAAAELAAKNAAATAATVQTVLSLEVPVLTALRFHLRIFHLARALRGLVNELNMLDASCAAQALWINTVEPVMTQAEPRGAGTELSSVAGFMAGPRSAALAQQALLDDDLIFLHSPAQIGLAILAQLQGEIKQFAVPVASAPAATTAAGGAAQQASPAQALASLDLVERFLAAQAAKAPLPQLPSSATPAQRTLAREQLLSDSHARLKSLCSSLDRARGAAGSLDKKALKAIEKKRKQVTNPLRDPSSVLYAQAREEAARAKEAARVAKKARSREESNKKEDEFLMGIAPGDAGADGAAAPAGKPADDDDDGGFVLSKRAKSEHATPVQAGAANAGADGDDTAMLPSPRMSRRGSNLAQQFAAAAAAAPNGNGDGMS